MQHLQLPTLSFHFLVAYRTWISTYVCWIQRESQIIQKLDLETGTEITKNCSFNQRDIHQRLLSDCDCKGHKPNCKLLSVLVPGAYWSMYGPARCRYQSQGLRQFAEMSAEPALDKVLSPTDALHHKCSKLKDRNPFHSQLWKIIESIKFSGMGINQLHRLYHWLNFQFPE